MDERPLPLVDFDVCSGELRHGSLLQQVGCLLVHDFRVASPRRKFETWVACKFGLQFIVGCIQDLIYQPRLGAASLHCVALAAAGGPIEEHGDIDSFGEGMDVVRKHCSINAFVGGVFIKSLRNLDLVLESVVVIYDSDFVVLHDDVLLLKSIVWFDPGADLDWDALDERVQDPDAFGLLIRLERIAVVDGAHFKL